MDVGNVEWKWRVGTLTGSGDCAWEQRLNKIRRVTILTGITQTGAIAFAKSTFLMAMADPDVEFDAEGAVVFSGDPRPGMDKDFARLWAGQRILNPGGAQLPAMPPPPMGPRIIR